MDTSKLEELVDGLVVLAYDNKKVVNEVLSFVRKIGEKLAAGGVSSDDAADKRMDALEAGIKKILTQTAPNDNAEKLLRSQEELSQTLNKPPRQDIYHHYGVMKAGIIYAVLGMIAALFIGLYAKEFYIRKDAEQNDIQWRHFQLVSPDSARIITKKYFSDPETFRKDVEKEEALIKEITELRIREMESRSKAENLNQLRPMKVRPTK